MKSTQIKVSNDIKYVQTADGRARRRHEFKIKYFETSKKHENLNLNALKSGHIRILFWTEVL